MRVLFCGGGTAGHVNPAIAVAQTVMRNSKDNKIAYVTTVNGIENQLVSFKKYQIDVIGFKRKITLKNLLFFHKQLKAIEKCKHIISEFHPDVIFGTGGYATVPVAIAASKKGIPIILHESNVVPGKAILTLQGKASKILLNFSESEKYFKYKDKLIHVGNPIRNGFEFESKEKIKEYLGINQKYVILCMGGSLGAERINDAAIELIDNFIKFKKDILFVWSTGKADFSRVTEALEKKGLKNLSNIIVTDYIRNIPEIMSSSDLVISRAGAMTISEIAYSRKASILIPSPNVTNNHQFFNAKALETRDAAILITEDKLYTLIDTVKELIENKSKRNLLEINISEYSKKDANKTIYNLLNNII